jgi:hypothetical protein
MAKAEAQALLDQTLETMIAELEREVELDAQLRRKIVVES